MAAQLCQQAMLVSEWCREGPSKAAASRTTKAMEVFGQYMGLMRHWLEPAMCWQLLPAASRTQPRIQLQSALAG